MAAGIGFGKPNIYIGQTKDATETQYWVKQFAYPGSPAKVPVLMSPQRHSYTYQNPAVPRDAEAQPAGSTARDILDELKLIGAHYASWMPVTADITFDQVLLELNNNTLYPAPHGGLINQRPESIGGSCTALAPPPPLLQPAPDCGPVSLMIGAKTVTGNLCVK